MPSPIATASMIASLVAAQTPTEPVASPIPPASAPHDAGSAQAQGGNLMDVLPDDVRAAIASQDAREITRVARPYAARCAPDGVETARCLAILGMLSVTLAGVREYDAARAMADKALAIAVAAGDPLEIAGTGWVHAKLAYVMGDYDTAERGLLEALRQYTAIGPQTLPARLMVEIERVQLLTSLQRFGEAEVAANAVIAAAVDPALLPLKLLALNQLALTRLVARRYDDAIEGYRAIIAQIEAVAGPDDAGLIGTLNDLAVAYLAAGRIEAAIEPMERAHRIAGHKLAAAHQMRQLTAINLGGLRARLGLCDAAEPMLRSARAALLDPTSWNGAVAALGLARCLKRKPGMEQEALAFADITTAFPLARLGRAGGFRPDVAREFANYGEAFREKVSVAWTVAARTNPSRR